MSAGRTYDYTVPQRAPPFEPYPFKIPIENNFPTHQQDRHPIYTLRFPS